MGLVLFVCLCQSLNTLQTILFAALDANSHVSSLHALQKCIAIEIKLIQFSRALLQAPMPPGPDIGGRRSSDQDDMNPDLSQVGDALAHIGYRRGN